MRFEAETKESHLRTAKRIFRYLKVTHAFDLFYPSGDSFNIITYVDADNALFLVNSSPKHSSSTPVCGVGEIGESNCNTLKIQDMS